MRIILNKEIGQTPLAALRAWQDAHPEFASLPACYAGRLDPMAEGKLLVLLGEECKKKEKYQGLDKEYVVEILLGVGTDTGDVLGIPSLGATLPTLDHTALTTVLRQEHGTHIVPYPRFSSKTVDGKPLFLHALEGNAVPIPTHEEQIYGITLMSRTELTTDSLRVRVESMLARAPRTDEPSKALGADFRIADVRSGWEQVLAAERLYTLFATRVTCGSGTYMRSLAGRIGAALGTKACALSIRRTKIGKYVPLLRLWRETGASQ